MGFGMDKIQQWGAGGGCEGDGGAGLCPIARMAATGLHNKVERVFLAMHIGFVGV